jgi:Zn-finger nucleic acid-binding protein
VEVDVCAGCKGLWLDANELEAIMESAKGSNPFQSFLKILGQ